jgi:hypothetical protein
MSKNSGDTARFNRLRKQKIARRQMVRELRVKLATAAAVTGVPAEAPGKAS